MGSVFEALKNAVLIAPLDSCVFRVLLSKLIEQPEEKQTFDRLMEMAEKFAAKQE